MPRGGSLILETGRIQIRPDSIPKGIDVPAGPYVFIRVKDTGQGMAKETQTHIFEPFFSTREHRRGLGLASLFGLLKQNHGDIHVKSAPGRGTTFTIYLPESAGQPHVSVNMRVTDIRNLGGSENVLVVDDERVVRMLMVRVLNSAGYQVMEASSGRRALEQVRMFGSRIRLLITDELMPRMKGSELAEQVEALVPGTPILYMSAYPSDEFRDKLARPDDVDFLSKPFSPKRLLLTVREILERKSQAG